jgi:DNA-binding transcriptional ArsR family regulator
MVVKKKGQMSDARISEVARVFAALAEPSRLKLLRELIERPLTVSELIDATGLQQGNVSKHLGVLVSGGFISREAEGNFARYRLADATVVTLCELMCARVEAHAQKRAKELS